jgi:hypothetical protein
MVCRIASLEAQLAELQRIALSDDGAGGDGMHLHLENKELRSQLAAVTAERDRVTELHKGLMQAVEAERDAALLAQAMAVEACAERLEREHNWISREAASMLIRTLAHADQLARAMDALAILTTQYACCASGEGTADFRFCADEAAVMAFYEEMFGKDMDGTINSAIKHFRDEDNWSCEGTIYSTDEYCARFEVWNLHKSRVPIAALATSQKGE